MHLFAKTTKPVKLEKVSIKEGINATPDILQIQSINIE
jgi:hypothetical protein